MSTYILGSIIKKTVTVGGFTCDGIQTATVFWPSDTSKKYPLLSFAHGWTEGGSLTDGNYKDVIESVAAAGYVVIAEHSGLENLCYTAEKHDQLHAIDYIKQTDEFASLVDWDSKVGVYGHSMGGAASGLNAADSSAISKYNLGAAVCLHPAQGGQGSKTILPTFFATGSTDKIVPAPGVDLMASLAKGPMVFAEMSGANHFECQSMEDLLPCPHGWTRYTTHWFNCHIKSMQSDCDAAYDICNGHPETEKPMSKCRINKGNNNVTVV
jgi:dienelactone hydrolase